MTDTLLHSPDATCWHLRGPEVEIDEQKMIRMPVKQYTHIGIIYTIMACLDVVAPMGFMYKLEVKRPTGVAFPKNPDRDFKVVKALLAWKPITTEQYRKAEQRLLLKFANRKREEYFKSLNVIEHTDRNTDIPEGKSRNKHKKRKAKHMKATKKAAPLKGKSSNSEKDVHGVSDNKLHSDLNIPVHIDMAGSVVPVGQHFKKPSGPAKDVSINTRLQFTGQYGHGAELSHIKQTVMGGRNTVSLFVGQCHQIRKLVQSLDCLLENHITLPVQITQPHLSTGAVVAGEPTDIIRTKGWLQLNNDKAASYVKSSSFKKDVQDVSNDKSFSDLNTPLQTDMAGSLVPVCEHFKKPPGPETDTLRFIAQCLPWQYRHGAQLSDITQTIFRVKNTIAGVYVERCHKIRNLVKSMDCLLQLHIKLTVQITQPHFSTGDEVADEPTDLIRTKGWLQLNNVKDKSTCFRKTITVKYGTPDDTIGSTVDIAVKDATPDDAFGSRMANDVNDDTSTMTMYQTEPLQVDVSVCKDDMQRQIEEDVDDDCFGVLGVFCRSSLHGDYSGCVTDRTMVVGCV